MNLLQILSNSQHLLHNTVEIIDNENILSSFNGQKINIYADEKVFHESLAREIIFSTLLLQEKKYYKIEHTLENSKRIDAIAEPYGQGITTSVLEFKNVSSDSLKSVNDLNQVIDVAKSQILNFYLKDNRINDCFVSVIVTDIVKIIKSPNDYSLYFETDQEKKAAMLNSLKKYGICIKTYKYNKIRGVLEDMKSNHVCCHALLDIISLNSMKKKTLLPDSLTTTIACSIKNAINLPTKSYNSVGVKNVREVKALEETNKKKLVNELMSGLLSDFIRDSSDGFAFFDKGKTKDFTYVIPKTLVFNNKQGNAFIVATLDGALIDGQNSINCFKIIIDMIDKKINVPKLLTKAEKTLYRNFEKMYMKTNHIKTMTINENILSKIKEFAENQMLKIEIVEVENKEQAINYAIAKNNSMPVSKSELCCSKMLDDIQLLSYQFAEAYIDLIHSKKNKPDNIMDHRDKITFEKVMKLLHLEMNMKLEKSNIFKVAYRLNSSFNNNEFKTVQKKYLVRKLNLTDIEKKSLDNIEDEIRELSNSIEREKEKIKEANDDFLGGYLNEEGRDRRYNIINTKIETFSEKIKCLKENREAYVSYGFNNINEIIKISRFYIDFSKIIKKVETENDKDLISQYFNINEYWHDIVYIYVVKKYKDYKKLNEEQIVKIFRKITDNFKYLSENYDFGTTTIRNGNAEKIPNKKDDKSNITISDFFNILTNI